MPISRFLSTILLLFLVLLFRVWHLGVIQREERVAAAELPQRRTVYVRPNRGTISDRFGISLAANRISHRAAFYYNQLASIPSVSWREEGGKKVKVFPRREYIEKFALFCQEALGLDRQRVEDLIHSKASLFPHLPFPLKDPISEREYFTLKAKEAEWPGLFAEIASERHYPLGKTACHLLGMIGRLDRREYNRIAEEAKKIEDELLLAENGLERPLLEGFSSFQEMAVRLQELKEKAYSLTDWVGKMGAEKQFEEQLRGCFGKQVFEVDQKGRLLKKLPWSQEAIPGEHITLTISAELQEFAEQLLEEEERKRPVSFGKDPPAKGGAIVALDPNTGEILALASSPRFDPNDFVRGSPRVSEWLENSAYLGGVWDGIAPSPFSDKTLSWEEYLTELSYPGSPLHLFFQTVQTVKKGVALQEDFEALLYYTGLAPDELLQRLEEEGEGALASFPEAARLWKQIKPWLSLLPDLPSRLFALDVCRLSVDASRFTDSLLEEVGGLSLSSYRALTQAVCRLEKSAREAVKEAFHREIFPEWRRENQREFLADARAREKKEGRYPKPYADLFEEKERELFAAYWEENRLSLLSERLWKETSEEIEALRKELSPLLKRASYEDFFHTCRSFSLLERPLLGSYARLRGKRGKQTEKELALGFYPLRGVGYLRSSAFQDPTPLGSIFKLITGYEALRQGVAAFSLVDLPRWDAQGKLTVASNMQNVPYPRIYKGGRLPKSSSSYIGAVDLAGALEQSSNPYFSILAGDYFGRPSDLAEAARLFGLGERSGLELPGEARGAVPSDLETNRTGLYSFAIGQHTLLTTPLQAALFLATMGNQGMLLKPRITKSITGVEKSQTLFDLFSRKHSFARKDLSGIGIPFALFTEKRIRKLKEATSSSALTVRRRIPMGSSLRGPLLEAMDRAMWSGKGNARPTLIGALLKNPAKLREHLALEHQVVGKTSTSQVSLCLAPDPSAPSHLYKHVWFGALSFCPSSFVSSRWESPELAVVTFLRFGSSGKDAAPLATQVIRKWREICRARAQNRQSSS